MVLAQVGAWVGGGSGRKFTLHLSYSVPYMVVWNEIPCAVNDDPSIDRRGFTKSKKRGR